MKVITQPFEKIEQQEDVYTTYASKSTMDLNKYYKKSMNNYLEQNDVAKKYDKQFLQFLWQNL